MKAITQKVTFKLKKNKSQTQQAILLTEMYSANMRELYQLINQKDKLPRQKFTHCLLEQLTKLEQNMHQQLSLYKPYHNKQLQQLLHQQDIPNAYSLISLCQQKGTHLYYLKLENQIYNLKLKLKQNVQKKAKQTNNQQKKQQILMLKKHLQQQRIKKSTTLNKIEKIKEQLQKQTKQMIQNKIDNFDQQLQFRKLQKKKTNQQAGEEQYVSQK